MSGSQRREFIKESSSECPRFGSNVFRVAERGRDCRHRRNNGRGGVQDRHNKGH